MPTWQHAIWLSTRTYVHNMANDCIGSTQPHTNYVQQHVICTHSCSDTLTSHRLDGMPRSSESFGAHDATARAAPKTKCSISLPAPNTTDHRVYIATASHVATCTHWHASNYSLSVSLLPHTSCMSTTACAVHCTCSIPFHLSGCDGPPRASVATAQYEAHMCTAEAQVTHSLH